MGRAAGFSGALRRVNGAAVEDSSAWESRSNPLAATTLAGRVALPAGPMRASDGRSRLDTPAVLTRFSSRSQTPIPVPSPPVPGVVGQALWGSSGPGTGRLSPTGGVNISEKIGRIIGAMVGGRAAIDDRSAR